MKQRETAITGKRKLQKAGVTAVLLLGLLSLCACKTKEKDEEQWAQSTVAAEEVQPLSVTMTKDDFEVTLSAPKSVYYVSELRKEDVIRGEVTVRYVGEEEEVYLSYGWPIPAGFVSYDTEGDLPFMGEEGKLRMKKGECLTSEFELVSNRGKSAQKGTYKLCVMPELEMLDPETGEYTGERVVFGLSLFPIEIRAKQGEPLATDAYEMLWGALSEKEYLTEKAEAYAEEIRGAEPKREIGKVLAGKEDALVRYAVFYEEEGVLSEIEVATPHGREFFSVGKEGEKLRLYEEAPPELSVDGTHVQFSTLSEDTGEIISYRVYVWEYEWGWPDEEYYNYIEVTGNVR